MIKYSIIIPTYKHFEDCLKPCLESIVATTDLSNVEVIVVANGCGDDGTHKYVVEGPFKLIRIEEPVGYTKATNAGILAAQGEYVILLNNDCQLLTWQNKNLWIDMLEKPFLEDDKVAVTGPSIVYDDVINWWHIIFFCVMIKRGAFDQFGLLDEVFNPGAGEDTDFCVKVQQAGLKIRKVPDHSLQWTYSANFPIYHSGGTTFSELPDHLEIHECNKKTLLDRYGNSGG